MRDRSEVKQKLKQVRYRYVQKKLRDIFKKRPDSCYFNRMEEVDETYIRLCSFPSGVPGSPRNVVCDPRVEGCLDMAKECPLWEPLRDKAEVKADFEALMASGDRGRIAAEYPDIAALMWVLDEDAPPPDFSLEKAPEGGEQEEPQHSWWPPRWLQRMGRSK